MGRIWYPFPMSVEPHRRISIEDYLAAERQAETKSEYLDGEIFVMSGASRPHNLIALNVAASLHGQLKGRGCEAYVGDMRVLIPSASLYTYPDITVVCGEPRFEDGELDTLLNPTLLIEVLSPTTEGYDRGKKFAYYRTLVSLREYVLVAQDEVRVELFTRQEDGHWLLSEASCLDKALLFASIGCELRLADVYDRVSDLLTPSP
jgi:Uma2 family endonuclease